MSIDEFYSDTCRECGCYNNESVVCDECYAEKIEQLTAEIEQLQAKVTRLQGWLEQTKTDRDDLIIAILYAVDAGTIDNSSDVAQKAVHILAGS